MLASSLTEVTQNHRDRDGLLSGCGDRIAVHVLRAKREETLISSQPIFPPPALNPEQPRTNSPLNGHSRKKERKKKAMSLRLQCQADLMSAVDSQRQLHNTLSSYLVIQKALRFW